MAWYCLQVKPKAELLVKNNLIHHGIDVCCPLMLVDKRSGSKREIQVMFQGYVFPWMVRGVNEFHAVTKTPGVISFVRGLIRDDSEFPEPLEISGAIIEDLKRRENADGIHEPLQADYMEGDEVRIKAGPFHGYYGEILRADKDARFSILLNYDSKTITIDDFPRDDLEPAKKTGTGH